LVAEHQSTPDELMTFRLFKYFMRICDKHLTLFPESKKLSLVYPLVIYNGKQDYNAAQSLFQAPEIIKKIWTEKLQLIDLNDIPIKETWFISVFHETRNLLNKWHEVANDLREIIKSQLGFDYIKILLWYTGYRMSEEDRDKLYNFLTSTLDKQTGEKLMSTIAEHFEQQGLQKGIQESKLEIAKNLLAEKVNIKLGLRQQGYQ
jgi:predicted transposase/invertase (TIGR01784 family)